MVGGPVTAAVHSQLTGIHTLKPAVLFLCGCRLADNV